MFNSTCEMNGQAALFIISAHFLKYWPLCPPFVGDVGNLCLLALSLSFKKWLLYRGLIILIFKKCVTGFIDFLYYFYVLSLFEYLLVSLSGFGS